MATMEEDSSILVLCPSAEDRVCDISDCISNSECQERTIGHSDSPELVHPPSSFLNITSHPQSLQVEILVT